MKKTHMSDELFGDLLTSVREAGAIRRGEMKPMRVAVDLEFPTDAEPGRVADFPPDGAETRGQTTEIPNASAIRARMGLSRSEFARVLDVSERTLENWEQGRRNPTGAARTLLLVAEKHPEAVLSASKREV